MMMTKIKLLNHKTKSKEDKETVTNLYKLGCLGMQLFPSKLTDAIVYENYSEDEIVTILAKHETEQASNPWILTDTVTILGEALPQSRPRATTAGNKMVVYEEPKIRNYKRDIKKFLKDNLPTSFSLCEGEVILFINFFKSIPKSYSKKKRLLCELGLIRPTTKPDKDNLEKALQDALNKVFWSDDAQIVCTYSTKYYSLRPRLEFRILYRAK